MMKNENSTMTACTPKLKKFFAVLAAVVLGLTVLCAGYLHNGYQASAAAMEIVNHPQNIEVEKEQNQDLVFLPDGDIRCGMIFYPGGKVAYESYAPLMEQLAENGVMCVLLKMTGNLAVLEMNGADGVIEQYPQIHTWYLGGHSLGGVAAAAYAAAHPDRFRGVVLLGAYANKDLSGTALSVLSVYGSEDMVMNRKNYEKNKAFLPSASVENVIEGGIHAYFGDYGAQKGDGVPSITRDEQLEETVETILKWIEEE